MHEKLKELCALTGLTKMTTDLDKALNDSNYQIYFDAQITGRSAMKLSKKQ